MKVIKFPRGDDSNSTLKNEDTGSAQIYLGSFNFTCPCKTVISMKPSNMIFKSIEFYCKDCGTAHKVSNPAFVPTTPTKKR